MPEILLLALALGVLFFGSDKIVGFARSLGRASGEFKKSKQDIEHGLDMGMSQEEASDRKRTIRMPKPPKV